MSKGQKPSLWNRGELKGFAVAYIYKVRNNWTICFWIGNQGFHLESNVIEDEDDKASVNFRLKMLKLALKNLKNYKTDKKEKSKG